MTIRVALMLATKVIVGAGTGEVEAVGILKLLQELVYPVPKPTYSQIVDIL